MWWVLGYKILLRRLQQTNDLLLVQEYHKMEEFQYLRKMLLFLYHLDHFQDILNYYQQHLHHHLHQSFQYYPVILQFLQDFLAVEMLVEYFQFLLVEVHYHLHHHQIHQDFRVNRMLENHHHQRQILRH
jgi:hypothetical protein